MSFSEPPLIHHSGGKRTLRPLNTRNAIPSSPQSPGSIPSTSPRFSTKSSASSPTPSLTLQGSTISISPGDRSSQSPRQNENKSPRRTPNARPPTKPAHVLANHKPTVPPTKSQTSSFPAEEVDFYLDNTIEEVIITEEDGNQDEFPVYEVDRDAKQVRKRTKPSTSPSSPASSAAFIPAPELTNPAPTEPQLSVTPQKPSDSISERYTAAAVTVQRWWRKVYARILQNVRKLAV